MSPPNRLAGESSPYLRQHAENPVDWYPWGPEAFARARDEDLPLMLSVGYSACHWCHVMAHESFEDPETAAVMNRSFVNMKVDREERPDVDDIYMQAVMAMSGSGGWPMTVFLTPDGRPFFGGTYFPKAAGHGRPGFVQLLEAISEAWDSRRDELMTQADELSEAVRSRSAIVAPSPDSATGLSGSMLHGAYQALTAAFDPACGGFGRAPKFPMTSNLELLLRAYAHNGAAETLEIVTITLDAMASGGIYDHLGGGFARYSVDTQWMVPHFEKMLYDNALIPRPYVYAWQLTGSPHYRQVVGETIEYVLRDLGAPEGGIYSAEDADSEGVEGKFYVWTPAEIEAAVGSADAAHVCDWYGVTEPGNFEGANILHRPVRGDLVRPPDIERGRAELMAARSTRVRPGLDDKVVTEWNAMFISTLAQAGAAFDRKEWIESAVRVAEFLLGTLRRSDGRWLRAWQRDGGARHLAYAVDYAHLIDAFTRLAEATGSARWLDTASTTADELLRLFWDEVDGGLYTTGTDAERLLVRTKDVYDGATPSANSVAAVALLRLGALRGSAQYEQAALEVLSLLNTHLTEMPTSVTIALAAVDIVVSGTTEIVVVGDRQDLVATVRARYMPNAVLAWGDPVDSPLWEARTEPGAYVCHNYACGLPARTAAELESQLAGSATVSGTDSSTGSG